MADQARRRRQRILDNADVRLRKLKGIRTDEIGEEQTAATLLDRDAASKSSNTGNKHMDHLPVGTVPSQPEPSKVRHVLEESAVEGPSGGVSVSSNADTKFTDEVTTASSHATDAATSTKHSTVAEQYTEKLEQMHKQKQQQQQQRKTTQVSRLWLLVAMVMVTVVALMHVHSGLSASSCFISLLVMATTQTVLQRPRSALQFLLSLLSQILTSVSLFMFTLVVYHMTQTMLSQH